MGVIATNWMFDHPALAISTIDRTGVRLVASEAVATAGLVVVIHGLASSSLSRQAAAIGGYVAAAIVFTASAAFANPAVTLGRLVTDSATGIAPGSFLPFVAAQVGGAYLGARLIHYLSPTQIGDGPA